MRGPTQTAAPLITEVAQYRGEAAVRVSATQLGTDYTATARRKVVDRWCEYFAAGPSPITDLSFISRTPKRMFASLQQQTQLTALRVKWGDYDDLTVLAGMTRLTQLYLGGAGLRRLVLHAMIVDDSDYSPLLAHSHTLTEARVAKARTMRPTYEALRSAIPAMQSVGR